MTQAATETSGTIELWLTRSGPEAAWNLINARARFARHSNRLIFERPMQVNDVFTADIAALIQTHLAQVTETAVFSHSEFRYTMPDLVLEGLRVLTHAGPEGTASASVRFVRATGHLQAIFQAPFDGRGNVQPAPAAVPRLDDLTVPVLEELLYPALEVFDHILEQGLSEDHAALLAARVKTMRTKRDELSDYIALLSSYVQSVSSVRPSETETSSLVPAAHQKVLELSVGNHLPAKDISWSSSGGMVRGEDCTILSGHVTR